jgi:hypothetical protein
VPNTLSQWLEIALIAFMFVGLTLVMFERIKSGKGPWKGTIQLLAVILIFPTIILLASAGKVKEDAAATLLGTIIGYLLSGIGKDPGSNPRSGPSPSA